MRKSSMVLALGLIAVQIPVLSVPSSHAAGSAPTRMPVSASRLLGEANTLSAHGQYNKAVELYQRALTSTKGTATDFHMYGRTLALMKKYKDAAVQYRRALQLAPKNVEIMNDLGVALAAWGSPLEAKSLFTKATRLSPQYLPAFNNLGSLLIKLGDYGHAVRVLEYSVSLQPTNSRIRQRLNEALSKVAEDGIYDRFSSPSEMEGTLSKLTEPEDSLYPDADTVTRNAAADAAQILPTDISTPPSPAKLDP